MSEPLVVGIAIASVAGFLLVASAVIFFLARTLRDQYDTDDSEDPLRYKLCLQHKKKTLFMLQINNKIMIFGRN